MLTWQSIPKIGQGTWNFRGDRREAVTALRRGMDLGLTHIDTAEMYGTESIVGDAIVGRRDNVFVVSKVLPSNASRRGTIEACEKSLRELRTDYLDSYLLHWRGRHPLTETFGAFEDLKAAGKIRTWGVSNFDESDLEEARQASVNLVCNQVLYHPGERAIEHAVIPWCQRNGVEVVAYSPFGSGDFPREGTPGRRALEEVAAVHHATARQTALAFVIRNGVFTIPKAGGIAHVEENAGALHLHLTPDDVAKLERAFPLGRKPRSLPMI